MERAIGLGGLCLGALCFFACSARSGSCHANSDCPSGMCNTKTSLCVTTDAGLDSGPSSDAGSADAGQTDAGTTSDAGTATDAGPRTVTGTFSTVYWKDDGTQTLVSSAPSNTSVSALVLSGNTYQTYPGTVGATGTFTIPGVPAGSYFLDVSDADGGAMQLTQMSTSTPDMSQLSAARADVAYPTQTTSVTISGSGLASSTMGNSLVVASSQANVLDQKVLDTSGSFATTFDWCGAAVPLAVPECGLPNAAKGDVVYFEIAQRAAVGTGPTAGVVDTAAQWASLNNMTLTDGVSSTFNITLAAAPQTGTTGADVLYTQFDALAAAMNPAVQRSSFALIVQAVPHDTAFPNLPAYSGPRVRLLNMSVSLPATGTIADTDYGPLSYGQYLDPLWKEYRFFVYTYSWGASGSGSFFGAVPMSPAPSGTIQPIVGPVTQPRINGADAFAAQTSVGSQPVLSWSAPTLGSPTSYRLSVIDVNSPSGTPSVAAVVYTGTSFVLPAGALSAGHTYTATITAFQAPWDAMDAASNRSGEPQNSADCLTATFSP